MSTTVTFTEFNGASATPTTNRTEMNLKSIDDSTSSYQVNTIVVNSNSFTKYQAPLHSGTYNTLSGATFKISSNTPGTGITITGSLQSTYVTPSQVASGDSAMSLVGLVGTYRATSPFGTGGVATYTAGGNVYASALRLQMQTTSSASNGDTSPVTITYMWSES